MPQADSDDTLQRFIESAESKLDHLLRLHTSGKDRSQTTRQAVEELHDIAAHLAATLGINSPPAVPAITGNTVDLMQDHLRGLIAWAKTQQSSLAHVGTPVLSTEVASELNERREAARYHLIRLADALYAVCDAGGAINRVRQSFNSYSGQWSEDLASLSKKFMEILAVPTPLVPEADAWVRQTKQTPPGAWATQINADLAELKSIIGLTHGQFADHDESRFNSLLTGLFEQQRFLRSLEVACLDPPNDLHTATEQKAMPDSGRIPIDWALLKRLFRAINRAPIQATAKRRFGHPETWTFTCNHQDSISEFKEVAAKAGELLKTSVVVRTACPHVLNEPKPLHRWLHAVCHFQQRHLGLTSETLYEKGVQCGVAEILVINDAAGQSAGSCQQIIAAGESVTGTEVVLLPEHNEKPHSPRAFILAKPLPEDESSLRNMHENWRVDIHEHLPAELNPDGTFEQLGAYFRRLLREKIDAARSKQDADTSMESPAPVEPAQQPVAENRAEHQAVGKHADGPAPPNLFWWNGNRQTVEPIPWLMLDFMWTRDTAMIGEVCEYVWAEVASDVTDSALKMAQSRVNATLKTAGVPWRIAKKSGHFFKKQEVTKK